MAQSNHARAPRSASGTRRNRRRQQGGAAAWMRPWCRAARAIEASIRLINSSLRAVERAERCVHRRPVRTTRNLVEVWGRIREAQVRLGRAAEELAATHECLVQVPDETELAPELLVHTTQRWVETATSLRQVADGIVSMQEDVLHGLQAGTLVPEQPAPRRPRIIILAPRPLAMRAFLLLRQPRVVDRIAAILRRRRRTPRPASVRVPRRNLLGRAPPLF